MELEVSDEVFHAYYVLFLVIVITACIWVFTDAGPGLWIPILVGKWMAQDQNELDALLRRVPDGPERRGE